MDSFTTLSLIKECFPLDGLGILGLFLKNIIAEAFHNTKLEVKTLAKISKDDEVTDVGSMNTDDNRTSLSSSQRSTEEGVADCSKQYDENVRRLLRYIIDEDVKSLEELMEETCDINQKIPWQLLLQTLNDREKHKGVFNGEQNHMDTPWIEMFYRKLISPFHLCILYRRFEVLTFLSSLEVFDETKIRDHLINSAEDIRRPILLGLKKRLEKRYPKASVFLGRQHKCDSPMFLVSSNSKMNKTVMIAGIDVKMTNPHKTDELENKNFDADEKMFDDNMIELLQAARREHEDRLYEKYSNLNAIGVSSINSRKSGKKLFYEPCLVLYCSDIGFIRDGEDCFPTFLEYRGESIPVDVRDGITVPLMTSAGSKQEGEQQIKMGCSIHRNGNGKKFGSIGPFVEETGRNVVDFLTCAHVLYPIVSKESIGKLPQNEKNTSNEVYLRSSSEYVSVCGSLLFGYFCPEKGVDIAVVEIAQSMTPTEGHFRVIRRENTTPNVGSFNRMQYMFNMGKMLKKEELKGFMKRLGNECANPIMIGTSSGSGPSFGRLHLNGVLESTRLEIGNAKFVMKEMYRVTSYMKPFIEAGDSGSGVFVENDSELYCIGIAVSKDKEGMIGYVTPIGNVMDILGDNFSLKQFHTRRLTVPKAAKKLKKAKRNCSE